MKHRTWRIRLTLVALGLVLTTFAYARLHAATPRQLVELIDIADLAISPDGRMVAFRLQQANIERNTLDTAWYIQDVEGVLPPRRVAYGGLAMQEFWGLPAPAPVVWSPDGRWIYYGAMIDGRVDVWRAATDGSRAEPVTLDPADVRDFALSADGRVLKYSVGATREQEMAAERAEYDRGILIDKTVPISQPLFRSGYVQGRLATQRFRGGMENYRASLLAEAPDQWKSVDVATGHRRDLEASELPLSSTAVPAVPKGGFESIDRVVDPHADRIATLTGSGQEPGLSSQPPYVELAVLLGQQAKQPIKCQLEQCRDKRITTAQWRPLHQEVLFTVTDRDEGLAQSIFRWNFESNVIHLVARSRGLINGGRDERSACGVSTQVLVCVAAEADRPPRLERIDLETGQRRILFEPNAALAMTMAANAPARFLRWKDESGQTITGQFFAARRSGNRPPPLFVNYYSCSGFLRGGFGDEWPLAALARQGISALCLNYVPLKLDAVQRYDSGLAAVTRAIDQLASAGEIDRDRVGMGGLSLGTEMTLWTVAHSDLLKAASVSSVAVSPLGYALRNLYDDSYLVHLRTFWQLGAPEETPERWEKLSMTAKLPAFRAPVLMQMVEQEYLRSLDYAIPLIRDHRAELYVFPEEAHNKFQPRHKLAVYERNLDWFKFWLLDEQDPDPAKQAQYARWRVMKHQNARAVASGDESVQTKSP